MLPNDVATESGLARAVGGLVSAPQEGQTYFSLPISHTYRRSLPVRGSVLNIFAKVVSFLHLRNTSQ